MTRVLAVESFDDPAELERAPAMRITIALAEQRRIVLASDVATEPGDPPAWFLRRYKLNRAWNAQRCVRTHVPGDAQTFSSVAEAERELALAHEAQPWSAPFRVRVLRVAFELEAASYDATGRPC